MKTDTLRKGRALAAGLTLMTTVLATAAMAQGPGGGGFGGPPPGQNGGGGFGGPGGGFGGPGGGGPGGGGRGGFGGRMPFALGAITSVDTGAGTVTITSQFGGNPQVIKVGADAQVVSQMDTTVADLKVGDQVQVQGVPTGITASQLTVGTPPAGLPGAGGFGGGRFGGPRPGGGAPGGGNAGGAASAQGFASATGTIKSLPTAADPHLLITLGPDAQLFLKMAPGAKITKYTTMKLTDLKVGDRVVASGQTGDDGTLTATSVGVNMPMMQGGFGPGGFGGGGRGGRGRRGGGQGPGGPNPGGFGGGGGGGFGGPPPPGPNDGNGPPPPADGGGMMQ